MIAVREKKEARVEGGKDMRAWGEALDPKFSGRGGGGGGLYQMDGRKLFLLTGGKGHVQMLKNIRRFSLVFNKGEKRGGFSGIRWRRGENNGGCASKIGKSTVKGSPRGGPVW